MSTYSTRRSLAYSRENFALSCSVHVRQNSVRWVSAVVVHEFSIHYFLPSGIYSISSVTTVRVISLRCKQ